MRGSKPKPRYIKEFKNRQTRTLILVDYSMNEANCYQAICHEHGNYANSTTYSSIMRISRDPLGWCVGCQEMVYGFIKED